MPSMDSALASQALLGLPTQPKTWNNWQRLRDRCVSSRSSLQANPWNAKRSQIQRPSTGFSVVECARHGSGRGARRYPIIRHAAARVGKLGSWIGIGIEDSKMFFFLDFSQSIRTTPSSLSGASRSHCSTSDAASLRRRHSWKLCEPQPWMLKGRT
ncbi:hypothetical protein BC628DRAFT_813904 [Trametes gibbosa]|nr:hypothetical protein BC628DRAFT_813904 [Trametes gibbosa]